MSPMISFQRHQLWSMKSSEYDHQRRGVLMRGSMASLMGHPHPRQLIARKKNGSVVWRTSSMRRPRRDGPPGQSQPSTTEAWVPFEMDRPARKANSPAKGTRGEARSEHKS